MYNYRGTGTSLFTESYRWYISINEPLLHNKVMSPICHTLGWNILCVNIVTLWCSWVPGASLWQTDSMSSAYTGPPPPPPPPPRIFFFLGGGGALALLWCVERQVHWQWGRGLVWSGKQVTRCFTPCQPPWLSQGVVVVRQACEAEFVILHCVNHHGYLRAFCGQVCVQSCNLVFYAESTIMVISGRFVVRWACENGIGL